jgi:hypothetical protein
MPLDPVNTYKFRKEARMDATEWVLTRILGGILGMIGL